MRVRISNGGGGDNGRTLFGGTVSVGDIAGGSSGAVPFTGDILSTNKVNVGTVSTITIGWADLGVPPIAVTLGLASAAFVNNILPPVFQVSGTVALIVMLEETVVEAQNMTLHVQWCY